MTVSFWLLIAVALTFLAALQAVFPQLFALARVVLGDGGAGARSAPLLRSGWSLAWALGPLLGAGLLARTGFGGLLWGAAAIMVLVVLTIASCPSPRPSGAAGIDAHGTGTPAIEAPTPDTSVTAQQGPAGTVRPRALALLTAAAALFFLAMFAGSVALPLHVTQDLQRSAGLIGLLYSACAAVEVLAALGLAALPDRVSQRALIAAGMSALVVYFALIVLVDGTLVLFCAQLARGVAIAFVGAAGIRLFQDLLEPATGRATALFANATTAGSLLAGVLAGPSVQHWGSRTTLLLCGLTAALGAGAFLLATSPRTTRTLRRDARAASQ